MERCRAALAGGLPRPCRNPRAAPGARRRGQPGAVPAGKLKSLDKRMELQQSPGRVSFAANCSFSLHFEGLK